MVFVEESFCLNVRTLMYAGVQSCFKSRGLLFITLISEYWGPEKIITFILPKNASGKILGGFCPTVSLFNYVPVDVACKKSL